MQTNCMSSVESTEATNSLFMNNPVGTVIVFLMEGMLTVANCAIVVSEEVQ